METLQEPASQQDTGLGMNLYVLVSCIYYNCLLCMLGSVCRVSARVYVVEL